MFRATVIVLISLAGTAWGADASEPPSLGTTDPKVWLAYLKQSPVWKEEVDLRPEFNRLGLYTEVQGARPSCAVFAVTGALEFQIARLSGGNFLSGGKARRLSEDYLLWSVLQESRLRTLAEEDISGFSYQEVCQGLSRHGLAWQDEMPNTFVPGLNSLVEPSPALVESAKKRWKAMVYQLDPASGERRLEQTIALLNAGVPVAIGLNWPNENTLRHAPVLHAQTPEGARHGVLVVGYWEKNSERERRLIFRNSYGPKWGRAGYGFISPEYFVRHVSTALCFTVEPNDKPPPTK